MPDAGRAAHSPRRAPCWLSLLSLCVFGSGCGPDLVDARGVVTKDGKPLAVGAQGVIEVVFVPIEKTAQGESTNYPATVNSADGSFAVEQQLPPGKYRISIQQLDPYPLNDKLRGAFYLDNSPIIREVTGDEPINIDLANPGEGS